MNWQKLYTENRLGSSNLDLKKENRTAFTQDYDKVVFSAQFRKLQNKTQVFPLPGAVFVHNRLTHSLEVASVGRSLGRMVGVKLAEKHKDTFNANDLNFYKNELSNVIQTACLAHDIGNPPFGHFGEVAIRDFFVEFFENNDSDLTENQKMDFCKFEGNANAFRILSTIFNRNGLKLTYTTLATVIKYPCASIDGFARDKANLSTKKSGFFDAEKEFFLQVMKELGIPEIKKNTNIFARHPFVFLVEAADDICYRIIDLEDACSLNIISIEQALALILPIFKNDDSESYIQSKISNLDENSQKLAFLRAMVINFLTRKCTEVFLNHEEDLLTGNLNCSMLDLLNENLKLALDTIDKFSFENLYNHKSVVEKELAGYHVIMGLLKEFMQAVKNPKNPKSNKIMHLLPNDFQDINELSFYEKTLKVIDFVSGMTDLYAIDLYRKLKGIQYPEMS